MKVRKNLSIKYKKHIDIFEYFKMLSGIKLEFA